MEMFRAFAGFVLGLFVMAGVYVAGGLDRVPHFWRNGASSHSEDPYAHSRYTVRAVYQPEDGVGANCLPHYEFHNRTDRIVKFYSDDGDDQGSYGSPGSSNNAAISMQPSNNRPQSYGPPNAGSSSYGSSQSYGGGQDDRGGQNYGDDSYEPRSGGYDSNDGDDRYYDEYPGDAEREQGGCSGGGMVKIYLDRDKKP